MAKKIMGFSWKQIGLVAVVAIGAFAAYKVIGPKVGLPQYFGNYGLGGQVPRYQRGTVRID